MNDDIQTRAAARINRWYALGWAALLCLICMPYSAAAQAQESLPEVATLTAAATQEKRDVTDSNAVALSGGPGVVNINVADATQLERLPRIGPARAQAILALRAKLKQFSRVEQLLQVKGIGRATFRMLRPLLTLTGPTTLELTRGR